MTPIWGYSGNTASLLTNTMRCPLWHKADMNVLRANVRFRR